MSQLPGWTLIASEEDLRQHAPLDPALMLIPPAMVAGSWFVVQMRPERTPRGALCRAVEEIIVGVGCLVQDQDDSVLRKGIKEAALALDALSGPALSLEETMEIELGDGEEDPG